MEREGPRIKPGSREQIGTLNWLVTRVLGLATGGPAPHLFTTFARNRRLFLPWLRFAGALMPGGLLPRAESELVILRVAHNCGCEYERRHHERLGAAAGLSAEEITRVAIDSSAWDPRRQALLNAADALHVERDITDHDWATLSEFLTEPELIEFCLLVGHYEMLATTLNTLRVAPDELPSRPPWLTRMLQSLAGRTR